MNTTDSTVIQSFKSTRHECSPDYLSERFSGRSLTFAEIADLAEKCDLWEVEKPKMMKPLVTFTIPTTQVFASISRVIE